MAKQAMMPPGQFHKYTSYVENYFCGLVTRDEKKKSKIWKESLMYFCNWAMSKQSMMAHKSEQKCMRAAIHIYIH